MTRISTAEKWGIIYNPINQFTDINGFGSIQKCRQACIDTENCRSWTVYGSCVNNTENASLEQLFDSNCPEYGHCLLNTSSEPITASTDTSPTGFRTISGIVVDTNEVTKVYKLYWVTWILFFVFMVLIFWLLAKTLKKK